jgi:hypothetical protein
MTTQEPSTPTAPPKASSFVLTPTYLAVIIAVGAVILICCIALVVYCALRVRREARFGQTLNFEDVTAFVLDCAASGLIVYVVG